MSLLNHLDRLEKDLSFDYERTNLLDTYTIVGIPCYQTSLQKANYWVMKIRKFCLQVRLKDGAHQSTFLPLGGLWPMVMHFSKNKLH